MFRRLWLACGHIIDTPGTTTPRAGDRVICPTCRSIYEQGIREHEMTLARKRREAEDAKFILPVPRIRP
jgi:hypothetical protein